MAAGAGRGEPHPTEWDSPFPMALAGRLSASVAPPDTVRQVAASIPRGGVGGGGGVARMGEPRTRH